MNTQKLRPFRSISFALVFGVLTVLFAAAAMAFSGSSTPQVNPLAQSCGAHTLRGSYVFSAHGWNIVGGVAQPKAIVEGIDFNGDGTFVSPFATVSVNGTINRFSGGSGSYTVNPDCTGAISFSNGVTFDIFAQPGDGKQIWMIQTGQVVPPFPAVFEGTATKVSP